jgi:hypothetical protein
MAKNMCIMAHPEIRVLIPVKILQLASLCPINIERVRFEKADEVRDSGRKYISSSKVELLGFTSLMLIFRRHLRHSNKCSASC